MANRGWTIGIVGVLIVLSASVGLYLFARDSDISDFHLVIDKVYNQRRPGGGRLSGASYVPKAGGLVTTPDLGRAQVFTLRQPASAERQRLQSLIYLAAGEWRKFVDLSKEILKASPNDSSTLNNLGVSFLALADDDASYLVPALDAFERASQSNPRSPEPLFNLIITYRKLRFKKLADDVLHRYAAIDGASAWYREIILPDATDETSIVNELQRAVDTHNVSEAERIFAANPELCRRLVLQYSTSEATTSPELLRFIANQMERRYGDRTFSAMLQPLLTEKRDRVVAIRQLVNRGAQLYTDRKYPDSLAAYAEASKQVSEISSPFDDLWIDLNKVDTQIRLGEFESVRDTLFKIVRTSDEQGLLWLKARALAIYGSTLRLTSSYSEMLDLLSQADDTFRRLEAPHDRIRVLYYLAAYRYYGGDQEEALRLALECLRFINDDDWVRLSTMDWLIGSILYRTGTGASLLFAKEAVEEARMTPTTNGLELVAATTLAELYQSTSEPKLAETYIATAESALQTLPTGFDRVRSELALNTVKAKLKMDQARYEDAEKLLEANRALYSQQPFSAGTPLLTPSLMLLAQVYSETGRKHEAGRKLTEAIDVVEKDDEYMKLERFRVKFDDERRDLYDFAIDFEFKNGSRDAAWTYLQKYRAKLFLEFLAAFNPTIETVRTTHDPAAIQRKIPRETQVLEYALLKDKLLIWVLSNDVFTVRSVPVSRMELEAKVQNALERVRIGDEADGVLVELEKLLIEPVAGLLNPKFTLAIIPDRALHGLPFGALKNPTTKRYLIEEFPIVESPSLTHFLTTSGAQPKRDSIVGFGSQNAGSAEFKELAALADIYPKPATFAGDQVNKPSFLGALQKAPVFHYAGHSATDAVDPLRSSILLDGNRMGPNSVTAVDISEHRLVDNAVVVLSSCDSSVGNSRDGIGVRGLTSAFLIAGAGSVVGSLWPVEESSTADLMIRFHRAFANSRLPVALALREAQLAFLKAHPDRAHPYYWSAFVVTGNVSALK